MKKLLALLLLVGCGREPVAPSFCAVHQQTMIVRTVRGDSVGVVTVATTSCR